jgi:DNA primase
VIDPDRLRRIRNDLPMAVLIAALGRDGPPSKVRGGRFVFQCPHCGEMDAAVNPRNNLAHCFSCAKNLNAIDLLRLLGYDFVRAVAVLEGLLERHDSRRPKGGATPAAH